MTTQAAQQTEVYWMALIRDVPFSQFGNDGLVQVAAGKLHCTDTWLELEIRC